LSRSGCECDNCCTSETGGCRAPHRSAVPVAPTGDGPQQAASREEGVRCPSAVRARVERCQRRRSLWRDACGRGSARQSARIIVVAKRRAAEGSATRDAARPLRPRWGATRTGRCPAQLGEVAEAVVDCGIGGEPHGRPGGAIDAVDIAWPLRTTGDARDIGQLGGVSAETCRREVHSGPHGLASALGLTHGSGSRGSGSSEGPP
jgi:hypothetical protein